MQEQCNNATRQSGALMALTGGGGGSWVRYLPKCWHLLLWDGEDADRSRCARRRIDTGLRQSGSSVTEVTSATATLIYTSNE